MSKVVVIGGGAAGMFASIAAAGCGHQVVVYEKNEKLGKKLYITGKGRCNITNACDMEGLFDAVRTNAKFLYSSFYGYTNQQVIDFFERISVPTKIERGDRVFPVSDHSSDVIRGLEREMDRLGVKVHLRTAVKRLSQKTDILKNHTWRSETDSCGCLYHCNRRAVLSVNRINRRWIPVCRKSRTYGDGLYACACADGM